MLPNKLIIYRRERSNIWQCRLKVDGKWLRATTKQYDLAEAQQAANELLIEAKIRKRENLPVITRKLRDVAKQAIQRMENENATGVGKASYKDYIKVISDYLVPCLGKHNVARIDYAALNHYDAWRIEKMGKVPTHSTQLTHNAALKRIFDEAVIRGFMVDAARPKLEAKGRETQRRPAFDVDEIRAMLAGFDSWVERGRNEAAIESRLLLRDYVHMLLDTGARPGKELLNLRWNQIKEKISPIISDTIIIDSADGEAENQHDLRRSVLMHVAGKTGKREILGMARSSNALRALAQRKYPNVELPLLAPLQNVARPDNNAFVFGSGIDNNVTSSFQKMFERYLEEHNLLIDPVTNQKRVLYSLRHTYATLALTYDRTNPHTLARQMGTSIAMLEKHYSHLKVQQAIEQLRGDESRQLINATAKIDSLYTSNKAAK